MTKAKSQSKKDDKPAEPEEAVKGDRRKSPLLPNAVLWIGFLILLVAAVFTVVLPELEDDPDREEAETTEAAETEPAAG